MRTTLQSIKSFGNFEALADHTDELLKGRDMVKTLLKKCEKLAGKMGGFLKTNEGGKREFGLKNI